MHKTAADTHDIGQSNSENATALGQAKVERETR